MGTLVSPIWRHFTATTRILFVTVFVLLIEVTVLKTLGSVKFNYEKVFVNRIVVVVAKKRYCASLHDLFRWKRCLVGQQSAVLDIPQPINISQKNVWIYVCVLVCVILSAYRVSFSCIRNQWCSAWPPFMNTMYWVSARPLTSNWQSHFKNTVIFSQM